MIVKACVVIVAAACGFFTPIASAKPEPRPRALGIGGLVMAIRIGAIVATAVTDVAVSLTRIGTTGGRYRSEW